MSIQKRVEQKIRNTLLRIERAASCCELDVATVHELTEDARILAADREFIREWHHRQFPDEWLDRMISEAAQPHNGRELVSERRLFKWIKYARQRAKFATEKKAPEMVPEGMLI